MGHSADTLVPPSCIIYAFRIGWLLPALQLSVNPGIENARLLPVLLLLPPLSVVTLLSPSLTLSERQTAVSRRKIYFR